MTGRRVDEYTEAEVQRLFAEHTQIAEQGITITRREQTLVLSGEVESRERCEEILRIAQLHFPDATIESDIGVTRKHAPSEAEEL
jgi:osmotically-inducible protein OsmY